MAAIKGNRVRHLVILGAFLLSVLSGCGNVSRTTEQIIEENSELEAAPAKEDDKKSETKGYDLPIDETLKEEAEMDCKEVMRQIREIYMAADKGEASNPVISKETAGKMLAILQKTGCPVTVSVFYFNMGNYEKMDAFLEDSRNGKTGKIVLYEISTNGGINRKQFIFDGTDMFVLDTIAQWSKENTPVITYTSYTRIKEWKYTEKGWFSFEYCVPEPPEVSEIVNGQNLLKVKPVKEEYIEIAEKCLIPIGYQGNNLLCSNWDEEHLEDLDYNGLYEYLYAIKYQERFPSEDYSDGIPQDEFERLMMEYLPVTAQQIQEYAIFDEENQTYVWERLGCPNYAPTYFGTSLPEVTDKKENADGTVTLTVDAVCDMVLCDDAVITHELTIQFFEDGSFQYLGNKILDDGIRNIPDYSFRIILGFPHCFIK